MRRFAYAAALMLGALATASPASAAGPKRFWAKPDTPAAAMVRDLDECVLESRDVHANVSTAGYYGGGGLAGVIGAAIGAAIVAGIEEHSARGGYIRRCMRGRGYYGIVLNEDEAATYGALKTSEERTAWADRTYAAAGYQERLSRAIRPPVPALPEARAEPAVFGGLRLDPGALTPAVGTVSLGQPLLSGSASHRRTARLREPFLIPGQLVKAEMPAGTVMHEVVGPTEEDPNQTFWCGASQFHSLMGVRPSPYCFWTDEDGYLTNWSDGQPWLIKGATAQITPTRFANVSILIDESEEDLLGPMGFSVVATKIGKAAVTLQAKATKDGKSVVVWSGDIAFDGDGRAVLPFWSHRLVLTRSSAGLTAAYAADGDGAGWPQPPVA